LETIAYLVGEPDVGRAFRLLNLLGCSVLLVLEQEDDSMDWFGQNGKSIVVNAKDFMDSKIANTHVFENGSEERL